MAAATKHIHLYSELPHASTRFLFHSVNLLLSQKQAEKYIHISESLKALFHCAGYSLTSPIGLIFRKDSHQHQIETFSSCAECLRIIHFPYPNILIPSSSLMNKQVPCVFTKHTLIFLSCVCMSINISINTNFMFMYMYMYMCKCMCVHMCIYAYVYLCAYETRLH